MIKLDEKIVQDGEFVIVDDEKAKKEDIKVVITDYGDHVYDVHYLKISEDSLFGGFVLAGINGMKETRKYANHMAKQAGLPKEKIVVVKDDLEWLN